MKITTKILSITLGVLAVGLFSVQAVSADDGDMYTEVSLDASVMTQLDMAVEKYAMRPIEFRLMVWPRITAAKNKVAMMNEGTSKKFVGDVLRYIEKHIMEVDTVLDAPMSPAVDTEEMLAGLLQEHVDLGLDVLRQAYDGAMSFQEALDALDMNTVEIAAIIGSVYGEGAETSFKELWREHIGFFADYTVGLKTNNMDMMIQAKEDLMGYQQDAGTFFSSAIPMVEMDAVVAGAGVHATQLLESMDAYAVGDYETAFMKQRMGHMHVGGLANYLVSGIVDQYPDNFPAATVDGKTALMQDSAKLRLSLSSLLKEHVNLGLNVLRNAYDGTMSFDDSLAALDMNTLELGAMIGSVYGSEAETAFVELWRAHIGFFANHTIGLKTNDMNMVMQAKEDLMRYQIDAANFFSGAIPSVEFEAVKAGAGMHATQLLESMEAYADGDYASAYMKQREGAKHVSGLASYLGGGIVKQFPSAF